VTPATDTWTGTVSTDWNNPANWSNGTVPTASTNITIANTANKPVISGTVSAANVAIASGATLTNNGTLDVYGNWSNSGTLSSGSSSNVVLAGTGTLSGKTTFPNLEIQGTYSVGNNTTDSISVTAVLKKTSGTLTTNGKVALVSTANGTALIQENGGSLSGKVTVQHYTGGSTGYHEYGTPVSDATVAGWAGSFPVTGPDGANASSSKTFGTLEVYNEVANTTSVLDSGYYNHTGLSDALVPGVGYSAYLATSPLPTVSTFGTPNNGTVTVPVTHTEGSNSPRGWNLVGNPYPSPISWNALRSLNPNLFSAGYSCYLWKPSGGQNGSWVTYNGTVGTNGAGDIINSGLGFFVYVNQSGTLTFDNTVRKYTYTSPQVFGQQAIQKVSLKIVDPASKEEDEVVAYGTGDEVSSLKPGQPLGATNPTVAFDDNGDKVAIEAVASIDGKTELPIVISTPIVGDYILRIDASNIYLPVYLKDKVTGTYTDLKANPEASIVTTNKETVGRYSLVFAPLAADNLPLTTISVYPNPAKDKVTIGGNHIAEVRVLDNLGRVVKVISLKDATNPTLSLSGLATGTYHLRVQTTDGKVSGVGFVKE
jgi:hypothetical protein